MSRDEQPDHSNLQEAELLLRVSRNAMMAAMRVTGQQPDGWDTALPHLDAAARELEAAFDVLGVEQLPFADPGHRRLRRGVSEAPPVG